MPLASSQPSALPRRSFPIVVGGVRVAFRAGGQGCWASVECQLPVSVGPHHFFYAARPPASATTYRRCPPQRRPQRSRATPAPRRRARWRPPPTASWAPQGCVRRRPWAITRLVGALGASPSAAPSAVGRRVASRALLALAGPKALPGRMVTWVGRAARQGESSPLTDDSTQAVRFDEKLLRAVRS